MTEQKTGFPMLPEKWWWMLRNRFKQSVPTTVTSSYLASVLNIGQDTAAKIALPPFKKVGLIDPSGKPLERSIRWRDDAQYTAVCKEILNELYPQELLEIAPDPTISRSTVDRWFANRTGAGESAVRKMTSFYLLLLKGDVEEQKESSSSNRPNTTPKQRDPKSATASRSNQTRKATAATKSNERQGVVGDIPPALELLIRSLPQAGTPLPKWRRDQWIRMAREVLAFTYPDDEEDSSTQEDEEMN